MAKRRVANVTNNGNNAPVKDPVKKAPKKVPEPPIEEEDLLSDEEMEEIENEVKPSFWTRVKESKPVQTGKKILKIGALLGVGWLAHEAVDKVRENVSSDEGDYKDEYDDDSSSSEE